MDEENLLEQVRALGLDTSDYKLKDGEYWVGAHDANLIIKALNPHIAADYLNKAVRYGKVERYLYISPKTYLYKLSDLLLVEVRKSRGLPGGSKLPYKKRNLSHEGLQAQIAGRRRAAERRNELSDRG